MTSKAVFLHRHFIKQILDRLLRQRNGLMIYNKIERVLVITKWIFNHYNTDFSLEITSKVQKVSQKYTFTHKLTTKRNFQTRSLFFSSTGTEWNAQDCRQHFSVFGCSLQIFWLDFAVADGFPGLCMTKPRDLNQMGVRCGRPSISTSRYRSKDSLRFDIQISFGYKYAVRCHRHANNTEWHSPWFVNSYDGVFRAEIRFFFRRDP